MSNYRFGFDAWGLALFVLIMAPTFIWLAIPAPSDILRQESVTPLTDMIASVCQAVMVAALCFLKRIDVSPMTIRSKWLSISLLAVAIYYACWLAYYAGSTEKIILFSLSLFPCITFLTYEIDRRHWIAFIPTIGFTILHIWFAICNFVL